MGVKTRSRTKRPWSDVGGHASRFFGRTIGGAYSRRADGNIIVFLRHLSNLHRKIVNIMGKSTRTGAYRIHFIYYFIRSTTWDIYHTYTMYILNTFPVKGFLTFNFRTLTTFVSTCIFHFLFPFSTNQACSVIDYL